jgi:hypothetical protein
LLRCRLGCFFFLGRILRCLNGEHEEYPESDSKVEDCSDETEEEEISIGYGFLEYRGGVVCFAFLDEKDSNESTMVLVQLFEQAENFCDTQYSLISGIEKANLGAVGKVVGSPDDRRERIEFVFKDADISFDAPEDVCWIRIRRSLSDSLSSFWVILR